MVTIKRIAESGSSAPTVTITLKGSTPDQDKLLYTLVNGSDDASSKPAEQPETISNNPTKNKKKKQKQPEPAPQLNQKHKPAPVAPQVVTKELKVTVALDMNKNQQTANSQTANQKLGKNNVKNQIEKCVTKQNTQKSNFNPDDLPIPMLRLPPGKPDLKL